MIGSTESTSQPLTSGVPQGSILDPLLFILYLAPLEKIIKSHGLDCIFYADDSQIYITIHYDGRDIAIAVLDQCISDIQAFFKANNLSCNPTKTDIVHFYSRFSNLSTIPSINISQHVASASKETRNLGLIFDSHLTMSSHINSICRSASLALRNIGRVRKYLNQANTERLVHVFISSRLDYCNSLLYGLPAKEINKLQRLQNSAARLVTKSKLREHITPVLKKLHWPPVDHRIIFKVLLITFKIICGCAPSYLKDLLEPYIPRRSLRSATQGLLVAPKSSTRTYGDRAFSVAAPKLWNKLPTSLRTATSIRSFKDLSIPGRLLLTIAYLNYFIYF